MRNYSQLNLYSRRNVAAMILLLAALAVFLPRVARVASSSPSATFASSHYRLPGGIVDKSSPSLADLDGDGVPEVLVGTTRMNGASFGYDRPAALVVLRGDGTQLWSQEVDAPINTSPTVGDINNDGQPEIVIGVGGDVFDMLHPGGVIAFDRHGNQLWRFSTQDYYPRDGYGDGVFSTPVVCDLEGDGDMEIAFGGWDQRIYLLDHNGNSLWNNAPNGFPGLGYMNADSIWSSPACADLNGDGLKEIVTGADISGGGILPDGTRPVDGGYLYVFDLNGNVLVRRAIPEAIYSSPAIGDLEGDGDLEIVVGTSDYWWKTHGKHEQPYVYAFATSQIFNPLLSYADPARLPDLPGWPQATSLPGTLLPGFSSPALADLDLNGDLEIVIGSGNHERDDDVIAGTGAVFAWHHDGSAVSGWPIVPRNVENRDSAVVSSPIVADVDADGGLEVLFAMIWDVQVYNADGSFQAILPTSWTTWGSPAVGDTDGDGRADVWIGGSHLHDASGHGYMWRFESDASGYQPGPWPMFHANSQHTGYVSPAIAKIEVDVDGRLMVHAAGGGTKAASFRLQNSGAVPFTWQVMSSPTAVEVSPGLGALKPGDGVEVSLRVNAAGYGSGTHPLGDIEITAHASGTIVRGGPVRVPVTLSVAAPPGPYWLFVPLARRAVAP